MFETLEGRRYMYGGGSFSPLYLYGTEAADTITLSQSGTALTVVQNGVTKTYSTSYMVGGTTPYNGTPAGISKVVVYGYGGNDTIKGDWTVQEPMEIYGGLGNDSLRGGARADTIYGNSTVGAEFGYDTLDGGDGNDMLRSAYYGASTVWGGAGNDTLVGGQHMDTLYGGTGNDSVDGGGSSDYLWGDDDDDTLVGGDGVNTLVGGDGNDLLTGGLSQETLWGGEGNDTLKGNGAPDQLNGGGGDDLLDGGYGGGDQFSGGSGTDTADFSMRTSALTLSIDDLANDGQSGEADNVRYDVEVIKAGSGSDTITGSIFSNAIYAGDGDDTVRAGSGNDTVYGGWGEDVIYGQAGNDSLLGEASSDRLYDGSGNDYLFGDYGLDTLVSVGGGAYDTLDGGMHPDQIWADSDGTEVVHAESSEYDAKAVHRVGSYTNGVSKEPSGQNFSDPAVEDSDTAWYSASQSSLDDNPLFPSWGPDEDDVNQGGLGDCWFLATLSSVAMQNSERMQSHVVDLGDGTYAAMFFEDGVRQYYRVDNDLPVNSNGSLAYANTGQEGTLWVAILEKAYALHEGGEYGDLSGGWADDAFDDLGISNDNFDVDDDNIAATIKAYLDAGHAVAVDTIWTLSGFDLGENWVASHVYTVVDINIGANTITVRNPWATDAGSGSGAFVQGANDGYVTYTLSSFIDVTEDYTVGYL